jgi:hypothetical protein
MTPRKLYYLLWGSLGFAIVALVACTYLANMLLQQQSKKLVDTKTQGAVLDQTQQQLSKARADIVKYKPLADLSKNIVPQDKDQAQTVREIVALADANGVKLGTITFPSSTLGGKGTSASKSGLSQLKPVKNISGVYSLDITVQSDAASPAPYNKFLSFLDALEHNRRTALVSGVSIQPDNTNPANLSFTLNLSEYVKP